MSGDDGHYSCGIGDIGGEWADAVEGGGEGYQAVARYASVCWHHRWDAAVRAWLPD